MIITTTTHMALEYGRPFVEGWKTDTLSRVREALDQYGCVITAAKEQDSHKQILKYKAFATGSEEEERVKTLSSFCDLLLIEADGSRKLPIKAPGPEEPVIPAITDTVIAVLGLSALGKPIQEVGFRPERIAGILHKSPEKSVLPEDYLTLAASKEGLQKNVGKRKLYVILNQADVLKPRRAVTGSSNRVWGAEPEKLYTGTMTLCSLNPGRMGLLLLAAGNSRRYGRNKLLEPVEGQAMYSRVLEAFLEAGCGLPDIITQYPEIEEKCRSLALRVFLNPEPDRGISSSLKIGLSRNLDRPYCLFSVCDQPWLRPETIRRFILAYLGQKKGIGCLSYKGKTGNPCIFSSMYYPELLSLTGDIGGKAIIRKHPEDVFLFEADDEKELTDIDVRSDNPFHAKEST